MIRLLKALGYSISGLKLALQHEAAFLQEVLLCLILIPIACWLSLPISSKILMISSLILILIVELINSAIEAVVDRISLEKDLLAKKAKDYGSAAVLLCLINATVVWLVLILAPGY